ncbi:MAG: Ig-like domain repeat protein, partial [Candidatus Thermoplasmatota archaeon]|nr:Ig-like domain repeat protein [Candidatus Thermoplasmatota archaeon]
DNTAPVVTITAPVDSMEYQTADVPVGAYNVVELNTIATEITGGWSNVEGTHTFWVNVTDAAGNYHNVSVTYIVDNTAPVVTITAPVDGMEYQTADVPVGAYNVVEANTIASEVTGGYSTVEGTHTFWVNVTDAAGNYHNVSVTYIVDNTAPVVTITAPVDGMEYQTADVPVG